MLFHLWPFDIKSVDFICIIDVLLVGYLVYWLYRLIAGSTAVKVSLGFLVIYCFYFLIKTLQFPLLSAILEKFISIGPLLPLVLFQREIRHFLSNLGKVLLSGKEMVYRLFPWLSDKKNEFDVTPIVKAVQVLGGSNTGALIVLTKDADLRYYEESGDLIHAVISARLLIAIFNEYSPLHDGAVIIHSNKIVAARCVLPVTENPAYDAHFGLRHKAAVGLTEITDTLVIVVSEESGQLSVAKSGKIETNLSSQEVRSAIKDYLS